MDWAAAILQAVPLQAISISILDTEVLCIYEYSVLANSC